MGECRKLATEPLGSLGTLRVVGSVVVCVVVCMRVQHSLRHRHESCQNCGKNLTQEKRKKVTLRHVSFSPLGTSKVRQAMTTQPPPTPVLARPAAKSWPAHQELTCRHHFTLSHQLDARDTRSLLAYSDGSVIAGGVEGFAAAVIRIGSVDVSATIRLAAADRALSSGRSEWAGCF